MNFSVSSDGYDVISSGVVFAFREDADITFHFVGDENFKFNLKINFTEDGTGEPDIKKNVDGENIEYTCINFTDEGTGIGEPIELATFRGRKIYFKFWSYMEGGGSGKGKSRKIEYTFFSWK